MLKKQRRENNIEIVEKVSIKDIEKEEHEDNSVDRFCERLVKLGFNYRIEGPHDGLLTFHIGREFFPENPEIELDEIKELHSRRAR